MDMAIDISIDGTHWKREVLVMIESRNEMTATKLAAMNDSACIKAIAEIIHSISKIHGIVDPEIIWKKPGMVQMLFFADTYLFDTSGIKFKVTIT